MACILQRALWHTVPKGRNLLSTPLLKFFLKYFLKCHWTQNLFFVLKPRLFILYEQILDILSIQGVQSGNAYFLVEFNLHKMIVSTAQQTRNMVKNKTNIRKLGDVARDSNGDPGLFSA